MPNGVVVPCINTAYSRDVEDTAQTVWNDGYQVANALSYFARSTGNEHTLGGIISGQVCGKASFITFSPDVFIEGQPVPRRFDLMVHNHGSPPNAVGSGLMQANPEVAPELGMICEVVCWCVNEGLGGECVQLSFAEELLRDKRVYWDPRVPNIYVEVPFDMLAPGGPEPMLSSKYTSVHPPHLPLPEGSWWPIAGTRRPDLVIVKNPLLPLTRSNIKRIVEVKMPGDVWREGQYEAYVKIDPKLEPIEVSAEECCCKDGQPNLEEVHAEAEQQAPEDEFGPPLFPPFGDAEKKRKEGEEDEKKDEPRPTPVGPAVTVVATAGILVTIAKYGSRALVPLGGLLRSLGAALVAPIVVPTSVLDTYGPKES
jgi:hypothetical protein